MAEQPAPSVGRIVHYVSHGTPVREDGTQAYPSLRRAAIITEVRYQGMDPGAGWVVGLAVLNPTGMFFNENVPQSEDDHRGGSWHWPEHV